MIPVDQRGPGDCLRACLASIFEVPWEEAPDTDLDESDPNASQHNVVNAWLKERGVVEWSLYGREPFCQIKRGELVHLDGTRSPADFVYPYPPASHYVGGGVGPRGHEHAVVMFAGKIVHDPHPDRDMTIDRIESIHVYVRRG